MAAGGLQGGGGGGVNVWIDNLNVDFFYVLGRGGWEGRVSAFFAPPPPENPNLNI